MNDEEDVAYSHYALLNLLVRSHRHMSARSLRSSRKFEPRPFKAPVPSPSLNNLRAATAGAIFPKPPLCHVTAFKRRLAKRQADLCKLTNNDPVSPSDASRGRAVKPSGQDEGWSTLCSCPSDLASDASPGPGGGSDCSMGAEENSSCGRVPGSRSTSSIACDEQSSGPRAGRCVRPSLLYDRDSGYPVPSAALSSCMIPDAFDGFLNMLDSPGYGGRFVGDEGRFVSTSQSGVIHVYDTTPNKAVVTHKVECPYVSWTITDFDVSPLTGRFLAYATINHLLSVVDLESTNLMQESLDCSTPSEDPLIWSTVFSHDGESIVCGTGRRRCAGGILRLNLSTGSVHDRFVGHDNDVNSVTYFRPGDQNILLSGGDDGLAKIWDWREVQRMSSEGIGQRAACVFVGHRLGITHVSSRDDGRYFITTSKDQTIKLWDIRRPTVSDPSLWNIRRDTGFDYRIGDAPSLPADDTNVTDSSVVTYCGAHETMQTLIRSRFSPAFTTGQKYVYTGSRDGACVIYDVLTGRCVRRLEDHHETVTRDVSWHPHVPLLTTTSWDRRIGTWRPMDCDSAVELERRKETRDVSMEPPSRHDRKKSKRGDCCEDWRVVA